MGYNSDMITVQYSNGNTRNFMSEEWRVESNFLFLGNVIIPLINVEFWQVNEIPESDTTEADSGD